jgi:hypothetical protein
MGQKVGNVSIFVKCYHPNPWGDSISRPVAPISSEAGREDTTRPRRQGKSVFFDILSFDILDFDKKRGAPTSTLLPLGPILRS